jgi:hypothetical protein
MPKQTKVAALKQLLDKGKKLAPEAPVKKARPEKKKEVSHGKAVNYYVEFEDGTCQLAQGHHAHLIYRFTKESQLLATMHAFAYYEGPPMPELTKEEALKLLQETQLDAITKQ